MVGSLVLSLALDALFSVAALAAVVAVAITWRAVGTRVLGLRAELEMASKAPMFSYMVIRHDGLSAKPSVPLILVASGRIRVRSAPALRWPELSAAA